MLQATLKPVLEECVFCQAQGVGVWWGGGGQKAARRGATQENEQAAPCNYSTERAEVPLAGVTKQSDASAKGPGQDDYK